MKTVKLVILIFILTSSVSKAQLVNTIDKQSFNSTFCIMAYDEENRSIGIAIATNNLAIGRAGIFEIDPDIGGVVSIAFTNSEYVLKGIKALRLNNCPKNFMDSILSTDNYFYYRQLGALNLKGDVYTYTGSKSILTSHAGSIKGDNYLVLGNLLDNDSVLAEISQAYVNSTGQLHERLFYALKEGQKVGGQYNGKMSTALLVREKGQDIFNAIDLRVDYSLTPFEDLEKLLDKQIGLDLLRQVFRNMNNPDKALKLLKEAETRLDGWRNLYIDLSALYYHFGKTEKAVDILLKGIKENSKFMEDLSLYYFLKDNEVYKELLVEHPFDLFDWQSAIFTLIKSKQYNEAEKIANQIIFKYPNTSYLYFLLGEIYRHLDKIDEAKTNYMKSIELDYTNEEAKIELNKLINYAR